MNLITIENNGPEIISTNYWQSDYASRGAFYVAVNAGCFRLLVPDIQLSQVVEWRSAREVIISRGPWPDAGKHEAIELLFEDDSDNPFCLHMGSEQIDRLPPDADRDRQGQPPRWKFAAWTSGGKILELPARYRIVKRIPCLKPF